MFQTEGGQAFAEGIAEAFRRAKWDVECIRGGGFGPGIVVGPGRFGPAVAASLKRVTGTQRVEATNIDIPKMERDYIGIGIHRPGGSDSLAPPPISR